MELQQTNTGWHVKNWGTWGWLETVVKSIGIIAGLIAFTVTQPTNSVQLSLAAIVLSLLTLVTVGALTMRISQREVTSLVFSLANVLGHAGMLFYLVQTVDLNALPIVFALAFAIGDGIKLQFLAVTGYTEKGPGTSRWFVGGLIVTYIIFSILVIL